MGFENTSPRNVVPPGPATQAVSGFGSSGSKTWVILRRVLQSHERHVR
jgi:hypothetical protein